MRPAAGYKEGIQLGSVPYVMQDGDETVNIINVLYEKKDDLSYTVNYYKGSVAGGTGGANFLGSSTEVTGLTFEDEITLAPGTGDGCLDYKLSSAGTGYATGAQQGDVPYVIQDGENIINVVYAENHYSVQYDVQGSLPVAVTPSPDTITELTGVVWTDTGIIPATDPTATGWTFEGWKVTDDGDGNSGASTYMSTDDPSFSDLAATDDDGTVVVLTAQWSAKSVTVNYKNNFSTTDTSDFATDDSKYYNETLSYPTPAPTRTGYTFGGWYADAGATSPWYFDDSTNGDTATGTALDLTEANGVQGADGASPTLSLYAKWTANTYTLYYDANGGTGTMSSQTATYGQALQSTNNAFSKAGYTFTGWTGSDGASYANGYKFAPWNIAGNFTLTAQWTRVGGGGGGNPPTPPPVVNPPVTPPTPPQPPVTPPFPDNTTRTPGSGAIPPVDTPTSAGVDTGKAIAPGDTPLASGHAFSLLSMILSIVGLLIALLLIIFGLIRKRRFGKEREELEKFSALTDEANDELDGREKRGRIARALAAVMGILTLVVWLILDWPLGSMVWINQYTIFVAIIFIVSLVLTLVYNALKRKSGDTE